MDGKEINGRIFLKFKNYDEKTCLAFQYYKLPLQVLPPYYQENDGTAYLYLLNPSGGIFANDRFLIEVVLEKKSKVVLSTTSSNKFYKMEGDNAIVENIFVIQEKSVLEYIPEHSVPYADSDSQQINAFYLREDSVLIAMDALTSGRKARGEKFKYKCFSSKNYIYIDNQIILCDCLKIEPKEEEVDEIGLLEGNDIIATFYLYKKDFAEMIKESLEKELKVIGSMSIAATAINKDLAVVKILGKNILDFKDNVQSIWRICRFCMLKKNLTKLRKY